MGLSPLTISSALNCTATLSMEQISIDNRVQQMGGGPYMFHQTPSGSTLCQLGSIDPNMCSPTSSQSGSQPRLVHLSGGANDSGLSSLSGGFGHTMAGHLNLHQQNYSPDVRGELEELEPVGRFIWILSFNHRFY